MKITKFTKEAYPNIDTECWHDEVECLYCHKVIKTENNIYVVIPTTGQWDRVFFGICSETCVNLYILTHNNS